MTTYLSPQQATASRLAARGLSNTEIAAQMGIAYGTVKTHLYTAMLRTGARNRVELTVMVERGEIEIRRAA
jgi:DNA-binding CsgD family transcriptional regulator